MFDLIAIFRILLSIWPFLKEHFFESEKVLRHFQNKRSELTLFLMHLLMVALVFNAYIGVKSILLEFKTMENKVVEVSNHNGTLQTTLSQLSEDKTRLDEEVAFLKEAMLNKNQK